jgi:hypothetical protein
VVREDRTTARVGGDVAQFLANPPLIDYGTNSPTGKRIIYIRRIRSPRLALLLMPSNYLLLAFAGPFHKKIHLCGFMGRSGREGSNHAPHDESLICRNDNRGQVGARSGCNSVSSLLCCLLCLFSAFLTPMGRGLNTRTHAGAGIQNYCNSKLPNTAPLVPNMVPLLIPSSSEGLASQHNCGFCAPLIIRYLSALTQKSSSYRTPRNLLSSKSPQKHDASLLCLIFALDK